MDELDRSVCRLYMVWLIDDLKACQVHIHAGSDLFDLRLIPDKNRIGDAFFLCSFYSLQYRLILSYSDRDRLAVTLVNLLQ